MGASVKQLNKRLCVLHVIPSVSHLDGGPSTAVAMMEKALTAAGVCVTTATTDDAGPGRRLPLAEKARERNGALRHYAHKWLDFYKVAPGGAVWLWRNIRRFDVVHIHALFSFTTAIAGLIARWKRVPYVVRPLGTLTTYGMTQRRPRLKKLALRFIEGPILRHAAAVHFTSQTEWDEAKALGIEFRGTFIPLGIEPTAAVALPKFKGKRVVLYLSRLDPKKNVEGLLRAAALVDWASIAAVLQIAGDGDPTYVAGLKQLATSLGVNDYVFWLGHLENAQKQATFAESDLFILPSFSENFGIAAVEAMLAGLPCILGKGVGIARQVQDAGAGLIVTPDPKEIATAITTLLRDESRRRDMAVKGRLFAEREYSASRMAERLIALYKEVSRPAGERIT